jgi:hypothetical protein
VTDLAEVTFNGREDVGAEGDGAATSVSLWWPNDVLASGRLDPGPLDGDHTGLEVDVSTLKAEYLTPPQLTPSGQENRKSILGGGRIHQCRRLGHAGCRSFWGMLGGRPFHPTG